ncbi:hypothetical protein L7F22_020368 [Adiantum nelumboides]|nr:hypothetical protein [Adiantum nelumboides]
MDKGQEAIHFAETVSAQNASSNQVFDNIATQGQGSGGVIQEKCLLRRLSDDSHYFQSDTNSDDTNIMPDSEESRHGDHIKKRLPGLVRLTLPPTPELPTNSAMNDSWKGEDNDSDDSLETEADSLPTVKPFPVYTRMKTRLQDPPPITPVVKSQLTYCKSTLTRQKTSIQNTEQKIPTADTGPVCFGTLEGIDSAASSQTSANLGQVSSSSKVKPSASGEEEKDLLVDEDYIAEKKYEENKGLIITQWCSLLVLITLLVCTNKIRQLEKVIFLGLNLWRWQALTLVIFCGHLISGWIMKAIEWARASSTLAILLLDFEKACDRVDWGFLEGSLIKMGFPQAWIKGVSALYRSASSSITIGGHFGRRFQLLRSARQGCPLAPYLFLFVAEAMSDFIRDMIRYALEMFCVASGARINWDKSYDILAGRVGCFSRAAVLSRHAGYEEKAVLLVD